MRNTGVNFIFNQEEFVKYAGEGRACVDQFPEATRCLSARAVCPGRGPVGTQHKVVSLWAHA